MSIDKPVLSPGESATITTIVKDIDGNPVNEVFISKMVAYENSKGLWDYGPLKKEIESAGHPADTCELLFVNQGTLTLTVDGRRFIIREGCSAVARTDMPHVYVNDTNEVLEFTMTVNEKSR